MERAFILGKFNTWNDWRLILTDKSVTPPNIKTNYINIDGRSGTLDLSEALTGEITYDDRTVSAKFWTDNGTYNDRSTLLRNIVANLHGKKIKIIEPDDTEHYFLGRVNIKAQSNILPYATLELEAVCEPWRYRIEDTIRRVEVKGDKVVKVVITNGGVKTLCPEITVDGSITLNYNDVNIPLTQGTYKISKIRLKTGSNLINVSGTGNVIFSYREADI